MKKAYKILGTTLMLAAAFASVAGPAAAASGPDNTRGVGGEQRYFELQRKVDTLAALRSIVETKEEYLKTHGLPQNAELASLKSRAGETAEETAIQIVLTSTISERDADTLIERYESKVGNMPSILKDISGKTAFLHECQKEYLSGNGYSYNTARAVSDCAAVKYDTEFVIHGKTPEPTPQPVNETAPKQEVEPGMKEKISAVFDGVSASGVGIGLIAGALGVGGIFGLRAMTRSREKKPAPKKIEL